MNKKERMKNDKKRYITRKTRRVMIAYVLLIITSIIKTSVFATNDPIKVVNNLSDFVFGLIRAVGMLILGFGVVQVGMSLKSHDPSQRANRIFNTRRGNSHHVCKRNFEFNNRGLNI